MSDEQETESTADEQETVPGSRRLDVLVSGVVGDLLHDYVDAMVARESNPHVGRAKALVSHLIVDREIAQRIDDGYAVCINDPDGWEHTMQTKDGRWYRVKIDEVPDDTPRRHV